MRDAKIGVATLRSALRTSQPAGRNGTTADKPIGYGRPPSRRNGVPPAFPAQSRACQSPSIGQNGLSERPNRPRRKTTCESPTVARRHRIRRHSGCRKISTEKAPEFSFAARPKRTGRITAGPPHYPYPERPCNLGSEKPAKPPCENYRFYLPNRSRFSYHPGLNAFRHAPGFPDGTPSGNTDRRSSPAQTSNLTNRP